MSDPKKEKKSLVRRDEPVRGTKHRTSAHSGVTITGGRNVGESKSEILPTDKQLERRVRHRIREERKDAEWERGVVRTRSGVDRYLLLLILVLTALGLIALFSASYPLSIYETSGSAGGPTGLAYIKKQLFFAGAGLAVMFVISRIPYVFYRNYGFLFYGFVFLLLFLAMFIGHGGTASATANGVKRWIGIQGTPFNVQPSELMKSALIMILAKYFEQNREDVIDYSSGRYSYFKGVFIPFVIIGVSAAPVLVGKHLSGTFIVILIGVCIMFIGGSHFWKMAATGVAGGGAAAILYLIMNPYAFKRITTFLNPNPDVLNEEWQTTQGLYALGSGGFLGKGFGNSTQKFSYVSDGHTDFIFTIWGEEMGFIGCIFLVGIFLLFIHRGLTIAKNAPDVFSSLLASGIVFKIGIQVILNIMVVTDIFPNTGIPLPFFSYGGSSLIVLMAELGILLSISKHSYQKRM